jgi:hypothetical protein
MTTLCGSTSFSAALRRWVAYYRQPRADGRRILLSIPTRLDLLLPALQQVVPLAGFRPDTRSSTTAPRWRGVRSMESPALPPRSIWPAAASRAVDLAPLRPPVLSSLAPASHKRTTRRAEEGRDGLWGPRFDDIARRLRSLQLASGRGRIARDIAILETTEAVGRSFC